MLRPSATVASLLRTSLFVLLVLGALVRPMLNLVGDLHADEHAVVAAAEHGHHHPGEQDERADPDHTKGFHGLLHQADAHAAATLWNAWSWGASLAPALEGPTMDVLWQPSHQPTSPFRPPIV
ncbi:hypothetical protein [Xanthomonas oryzae]|uniref:hypothetical protein n=1 Tax=Xanthomonas oryzae TaxID=347 RepID=UPI0006A6616B|nr:hypothetical protein [Xanthomonas oryzae]AKJ75450.1 transmembrane protein [Xanthomonas oryzae pv. oryzicola]UBB91436.1 hypothetical protein K2I41_00165 [Xanthomonas oryzae pv. oryzicola]UBB91497.1 hypothetical protein K2I41_11145 [Xanthomonas oryzae pv. oryzicola]